MSKEEIYVETDNGLEVVGAGIGDSGCNTLQHHLRFQPAMSFNDWITNGMTHEPLPERTNTWNSRQEEFREKDVLRNFTKFTWKDLCQSLFFNKVACLRPAALLKTRLIDFCSWKMYYSQFVSSRYSNYWVDEKRWRNHCWKFWDGTTKYSKRYILLEKDLKRASWKLKTRNKCVGNKFAHGAIKKRHFKKVVFKFFLAGLGGISMS